MRCLAMGGIRTISPGSTVCGAVSPTKALDSLHSEADRGLLDHALLKHFIEAGVPKASLGHDY